MSAVELHHEASGAEGAPVLVLYGSLGTTLAMWEPLAPLLSERMRLVRVDGRGHGRSPEPPGPYAIEDLGQDVLALLDRLGLDRVAFAGLSIGGMVGQWLGIDAPDRVSSLVLMCTGSFLGDAGFDDRARTVREAGSVEPLADTVIARWLTPGFAERRPEVRDWLRAMLVASPAEGYAASCEAIAGMDFRADRIRITAPTLVVSGAQDPSIPPEHQAELAGAIPGARLETLDPAAHLASVERPDEVAQLILDHVLGA